MNAVRIIPSKLQVFDLSKLETVYDISVYNISYDFYFLGCARMSRKDAIVIIPSYRKQFAFLNTETKEIKIVNYKDKDKDFPDTTVVRFSFSSDDKKVAVDSFVSGMFIVDFESMNIIKTVDVSSNPYFARVVISNNQKFILRGGQISIEKWNIQTGRVEITYVGHESSISCIALSDDDSKMVSGENNGTIIIRDLLSEDRRFIKTSQGTINCLVITPDNKRLVSGGNSGTVCVWDMNTGQNIHEMTGHKFCVDKLALHPDGKHVASAGFTHFIYVWNMDTGRCVECIEFKDKQSGSHVYHTVDLAYLF